MESILAPGDAMLTLAIDATTAGSFQNTPAPTRPSTYDLVVKSALLLGVCPRTAPLYVYVAVKSIALEPTALSANFAAFTASSLI